METQICAYRNCDNLFEKTRKDKQYCSRRCKVRNSDLKNQRTNKRVKASRKNHNSKTWIYRQHLKDFCESCGFIPQHLCQLDVDHIDGNHTNNDVTNLQTLCSNCHRLKTFLSQDWE